MVNCPFCDSCDWEVQELDFDAIELDCDNSLSIRAKCHCYDCGNIFEASLRYRLHGTSNPHIICNEKE